MSTTPKVHLSKVIEDEDGNTVMLFPEDLLKALNLVPNEILSWDIRPDGIYIKRTNIIDNKTI